MNIGIIGCGYIGSFVAEEWIRKGHHITATTRSKERFIQLQDVAQKCVIFKDCTEEELFPLIRDNELLVVTIAPDRKEHYESAYLHTAELFHRLATKMKLPRRLIYVSSTSVYGDHQGLWVDETSTLQAHSETEKVLIQTENTYLSLKQLDWNVCILRFAEIYGPNREVSHRLQKLQGTPLPGEGSRYTNMIHKEDCVRMIDYAMEHHLEGIFNGADDEHPSREEYYDKLSEILSFPKVHWDASLPSYRGNKRISNHKIKAAGYLFTHPNRLFC